MSRASDRAQQRRDRRVSKRSGAKVWHTVTIDGAAVEAAVVEGVEPIDLVMYYVDEALRAVRDKGGDVLEFAVVTIGRHPDHPDDVTIEAKTDVLLDRGDGDA